ncbi:uncharacterized protein HKW66_Vig0086680 [Vigna angularis]|uniref:Uncharacterized protein n=1 Tax=Phaseolus angularis TaxID=3914 RepID=A0A8T0KHA1_PHAAN|nr:uncharacterized protein HKW66_Vig0086680 [Vigna angularis]
MCIDRSESQTRRITVWAKRKAQWAVAQSIMHGLQVPGIAYQAQKPAEAARFRELDIPRKKWDRLRS